MLPVLRRRVLPGASSEEAAVHGTYNEHGEGQADRGVILILRGPQDASHKLIGMNEWEPFRVWVRTLVGT